jgi:hypothetical protein
MAAGNLCETLSALREALKQDREKARKTAPRFNIFRLLGVERREVETHSALLAELFDPAGMHAQGDFFITSFLQYLAKKDRGHQQLDPARAPHRLAIPARVCDCRLRHTGSRAVFRFTEIHSCD